ncbi:hypothetical protein ACVWWO_003277 [Bradyrhizobium sp. F1.13.1]
MLQKKFADFCPSDTFIRQILLLDAEVHREDHQGREY